MRRITQLDDEGYIFGSLFTAANGLQVVMDRNLAEFDLTGRQWFLCALLSAYFDTPPTLKEAAHMLGNTHQNVKQIALKLEEKGFLTLVPDPADGRATRLHLNPAHPYMTPELSRKRRQFLDSLFAGITPEELKTFRRTMEILFDNLEALKGAP